MKATVSATRLNLKQPSLGKRTVRHLRRFLVIFFMGVAATLAWQSYGDAIREMIAHSHPQLIWLAPQTTAVAQAAPETAATTPLTSSADYQEQLKATSDDLAAVRQTMDDQFGTLRQRLDQLAAQLAATQQQMASDMAKVKAAEQDIVEKISSATTARPAAAPARRPAPVSSLPAQGPSVR
jgi:acyl transferase domain-containing protein